MTELHKPDIRKANPCPPCPATASAWEKCVYWLGIGLGSGLPKKAPGTWGTVGGLVVALPMLWLGFEGFLAVTVLGCLVGSYICGKTSDLMNVHDDPHIVFDEWVGIWISLLPITYEFSNPENSSMFNFGILGEIETILVKIFSTSSVLVVIYILSLFVPFILFRFFDIIKPFPIKWVDKNVGGGFGILIDDVLAGIMSVLTLIIISYLVLSFSGVAIGLGG